MNPREAKRANKLSTDTSTPTTRLRESPARTLGAFLRRMRDRATPLDARRGSRRRAAGLRREEVSQAAGISVTWYTWLEQGRDVRVSPRALNAIADALRLDATERDHLLRLADAAHATRASSITQVASEQLVRFVDALSHPAYAINGMWDVLHANRAATALLGEFRPEHPTGNVLTRLFLDPAWQRLFHPWDEVAASAAAQFRTATAHLTGDDDWHRFIGRLSDESDAFRDLWSRHDLAESTSRAKILRHPTLGTVRMLYTSLAADAEPNDLRVVVYTGIGDGDE
jgi:transcriptional regulator with XRE-family HTH domain